MKTDLDYIPGSSIIPIEAIGISPSQLYKFFQSPNQWYRSEILGEADFTGNTSSFIGTLVHFIAEEFTKTQKVRKDQIYKYLYKELVSDKSEPFTDFDDEEIAEFYLSEAADHPEIDINEILSQYKPMGNALIQYIRQAGLPDRTEQLISAEIMPGYFACGSCDAVHGDVVIDYKTTSMKSIPEKIPYNYKLQLLTYAWIYKQMGVILTRMRIVWITRHEVNRISEITGKPMKDYPATATAVTENITSEDMDMIEGILKLVAESIEYSQKHPEALHLIWKDYRLKAE